MFEIAILGSVQASPEKESASIRLESKNAESILKQNFDSQSQQLKIVENDQEELIQKPETFRIEIEDSDGDELNLDDLTNKELD